MSRTGNRKYICEDCKHEEMEHWTIRTRAKRPRCPRCGSAFYDLKTADGKADAISLLDVRRTTEGPTL